MAILPVSGLANMGGAALNNFLRFDEFADAHEKMGHVTKDIDVTAGGIITLVKGVGGNFIEGLRFKLIGTPAAAFTLKVPDGDRRFIVWNTAAKTATVDTVTGAGAPVTVSDGLQLEILADGSELEILTDKGTIYDFGAVFGPEPAINFIFGRVPIARNILIPADFAGSFGNVTTNPTASYAIDVQDDGASIGTITVSITGVFTFVTAGNTDKDVDAGSVLTFITPGTLDGTVAGLAIGVQARVR